MYFSIAERFFSRILVESFGVQGCAVFQGTPLRMRVSKPVNVIVEGNRQEFSMACHLDDRKNDVKMFKTLQ